MKRPMLIKWGLPTALILIGGVVGCGKDDRPRYIFINKTADHSHDLALKMSLKIAEQRSGIENALILLDQLPPTDTIEKTAIDLFQRWNIGADRKGRGILYLYSQKENQFKIEVSYELEGVFPDALCRQLEEAARTYFLSEIPQDFFPELLITMNIHGTEGIPQTGDDFTVPWYPTRFLSGGAGVQSTVYRPTVSDYLRAVRFFAWWFPATARNNVESTPTTKKPFRSTFIQPKIFPRLFSAPEHPPSRSSFDGLGTGCGISTNLSPGRTFIGSKTIQAVSKSMTICPSPLPCLRSNCRSFITIACQRLAQYPILRRLTN